MLDAFAAVEQRDRDRLEALYHPEVEFRWPPSLLARRPGQSWEQVWDPLQFTHNERSMNPRVVAANDREVVVLWRQRGIHTDGERFDGEVLGLYEVRDSKFARAQMFYFDTAAVLQFLEPRTDTPRRGSREARQRVPRPAHAPIDFPARTKHQRDRGDQSS